MKGAETFKALAEGKTLYFPDAEISYKLTPDGVPMCKWDMDSTWKKCDVLKHGVWEDECEIGEEYDLTFKEAMQVAINGHKIANDYSNAFAYRFNDKGELLGGNITQNGLFYDLCDVPIEEIRAKWKVVE